MIESVSEASVPVVEIGGCEFHSLTERESVEFITDRLRADVGGWIVPMNLDVLRQYNRNPELAEMCAEADLRLADGMPLVWASRLRGTPLPERVAGSNLISSLAGGAAEAGRPIFLLGGDEGTAAAAADVLKDRFPALTVGGTHCPPMGFEKSDDEMQAMIDALAAADPGVVFVALGCPKQERLIRKLRERFPSTWWMGVGISFSFLCGRVKRAPKWMQNCGLEWVHRLAQEPRRLFRRYIVDDLPFAAALLTKSAFRRGRTAKPDEGATEQREGVGDGETGNSGSRRGDDGVSKR